MLLHILAAEVFAVLMHSLRIRHSSQHLFQLHSWLLAAELEFVMGNCCRKLCKPCHWVIVIACIAIWCPTLCKAVAIITNRMQEAWVFSFCNQVCPHSTVWRLLQKASYLTMVCSDICRTVHKLSNSCFGQQSSFPCSLNTLSDLVAVQGVGSKYTVDVTDWPLQPKLRQVSMRFCPWGEAHAHPIKQVSVACAQGICKIIIATQSRCIHVDWHWQEIGLAKLSVLISTSCSDVSGLGRSCSSSRSTFAIFMPRSFMMSIKAIVCLHAYVPCLAMMSSGWVASITLVLCLFQK